MQLTSAEICPQEATTSVMTIRAWETRNPSNPAKGKARNPKELPRTQIFVPKVEHTVLTTSLRKISHAVIAYTTKKRNLNGSILAV